MNFQLPPLGGVASVSPRTAAGRVKPAAAPREVSPTVTVDTIPASPPPDVLEKMQAAAKVAADLRAQQRELHFEPMGGGRVVIQVRDLTGNVIRTVPPSQALAIAEGAPLS